MMKHKFLFFGLMLAAFSYSAFGYGYLDAYGKGSVMPGVDAVSHGFGGVSSVDVGGMNLFANPAELASFNPAINTSIGALILKQSVDDGLGKHTLTYAGLGASSIQLGLDISNFDIALGIAKIRDFTYKGEYFFVDSTTPETVIAGFENLSVSGSTWESAFGVGTQIIPGTNVGIAGGYRFGDVKYNYNWHHFNETIPDSTVNWVTDTTGIAWKAGVSQSIGVSTSVGIVYSSATDNCPASIAGGIRVGNLGAFSPGFGVEARIYDYEDNKHWVANIFGGMHPEHNLYFRGALVLSSRGGSDSNASIGLSAGATVDLGRIDISGAFNYGNETRDDEVLGFPEAQSIQDIVTAFSFGATFDL